MFAMRTCEVTLLNAIRKLCYFWLHIVIFIAVRTVDFHLSSPHLKEYSNYIFTNKYKLL
ncbi:hypothetical protein DF16_orf03986 [Bacillus thuringiensis serovar kurstaki str. YBT-1520]|nr:hypothetical protein DF16_orf00965 [Bacillus thuringiensis serovar kurstaki str. YBT-1520]AIM32401.1 hypothetical protein DF16_orf03986 [Bacillus thuringiensis serovar kurstaki str. YBT-1520]